jgi:hypothetical protein
MSWTAHEFMMTGEFDEAWSKFGLDDEDRYALQAAFMKNTEAGAVIPDSEGLLEVAAVSARPRKARRSSSELRRPCGRGFD